MKSHIYQELMDLAKQYPSICVCPVKAPYTPNPTPEWLRQQLARAPVTLTHVANFIRD